MRACEHRFVWNQTEYSSDSMAPTSLTASSKFVKFFAYVDELEATLRTTAGERAASAVCQLLVSCVITCACR